jgi:U2 small nuclear ribonucleoprotein B''
VVFSEITASTNAFRGLQDFDFYGKKMVLHLYFI